MTTRAQFIHAVKTSSWDLLDLLLEEGSSQMDDNVLFTDGRGDWWGLLVQWKENAVERSLHGLRIQQRLCINGSPK